MTRQPVLSSPARARDVASTCGQVVRNMANDHVGTGDNVRSLQWEVRTHELVTLRTKDAQTDPHSIPQKRTEADLHTLTNQFVPRVEITAFGSYRYNFQDQPLVLWKVVGYVRAIQENE